MKLIAMLIVALLAFGGCNTTGVVDHTPPAVPQGVRALALDNSAQIDWYPVQETDLAGYHVWVGHTLTGRFTLLATVHTNQFLDQGLVNGDTYYYAISSYDLGGNESEMSPDPVSATPRPEGFDVQLDDYRQFPNLSGFDFSTQTVGPYNDGYTDVYYESSGGKYMLDVPMDTDIQDMGYTSSLDDITVAPPAGWSPTGIVEAIPGHIYVVWTYDNHYGKVRVTEVSATQVRFDWSYQTVLGNPQLKRSRTREGGGPGPARAAVTQ